MSPRYRKKTPEEFVEALISDEAFRKRLAASPASVVASELQFTGGKGLAQQLFPSKPITLPPPHRIEKVLETMRKNKFFPDKGQDLCVIVCMVHPAFPLVLVPGADGAD